jgi:serralysin
MHEIGDANDFNLDPYAGATFRGTKTVFDKAGVIKQIDSGMAQDVSDGVITWGFYDAQHATGLYNKPGWEGAGYTAFSPTQRVAAREAIGYWDDLIAAKFVEVSGAGASERTKADILLANTTTGPAQAWAYYPGYGAQYKKISGDSWIASPEVNWTNEWFTPGGYGNTTLIHELGHSIGLSHPGKYNGSGATTYMAQAEYAQDSMQYSIMSYWGGGETGASTVNWTLFLNNYAQTPMLHDILTVQAKYGADLTTRTGDDTYGFGNTTGKWIFDFAQNPFPYLSIYDAGGNDTINASGYTASQFINLAPGAFSSVGAAIPSFAAINQARVADGFAPITLTTYNGVVNGRNASVANKIFADTGVSGVVASAYDNLSIAYGTIIENAIGGSARDVLWGNHVANRLEGRGGNDVLNGFGGADTLVGGDGNDTFQFSTMNDLGNTIVDFTVGDKIDVSKFDTNAAMTGDQAFTFIGNAQFTAGVAGQLRYANGVVEGDVNGDGVVDFSVIIANNAALTASDFIL